MESNLTLESVGLESVGSGLLSTELESNSLVEICFEPLLTDSLLFLPLAGPLLLPGPVEEFADVVVGGAEVVVVDDDDDDDFPLGLSLLRDCWL